MVKGASKYYESIHIYRLCIGYVLVILYAGLEEDIEGRDIEIEDRDIGCLTKAAARRPRRAEAYIPRCPPRRWGGVGSAPAPWLMHL